MEHIRKNSIDNAEHNVWGNGCDGWHFVNHPGLSIIRERMPPGTSEVRTYTRRLASFSISWQGWRCSKQVGQAMNCTAGKG